MTTSLKEQYALRKKNNEQRKLSDATQLLESHYLILEKLDTASIEKITNAMAAIETALNPHLAKLPSLKQALDFAEKDLNNLVNGRAGNDPKKINALLGKALGLYKGLSEFFATDLPRLLKLPLFKPAQDPTMKGQPVSAAVGAGGTQLAGIFQKALAVTSTGGWLSKLFASGNLPYVDNAKLAQELTQLSYAELTDLTKLAAMPAFADQASVDKAAASVVGAPAPGTAPAGGQPGAAGGATAGGQAAPVAGGAHPNAPEMRKALAAFVAPDKLDAALAALTKAVTA